MVILLKNKSIPYDQYDELFSSRSDSLFFVPLLSHEGADFDDLRNFLGSEQIKLFDSLIFTSQRAVEAVAIHLSQLESSQVDVILAKPAYTVGPTTAFALRQQGFKNVRGEEAGNGARLSEIILDESTADMKYVFFSGEITRGVIQSAIRDAGLLLVEKVVYRTSEIESAGKLFKEAFEKHDSEPVWVVFFSPSGTAGVLSVLKQMAPSSYFTAAIGPTTETFLKEQGLEPDVTADQPTAKSLVEAIEKYQKAHKSGS